MGAKRQQVQPLRVFLGLQNGFSSQARGGIPKFRASAVERYLRRYYLASSISRCEAWLRCSAAKIRLPDCAILGSLVGESCEFSLHYQYELVWAATKRLRSRKELQLRECSADATLATQQLEKRLEEQPRRS